ncbi:D-2-hydroxyacid dehydrogenase [Saccharomonospora azurea]|uniref:Phosphoglycerate dehydrogenase-like oxidoreductase n=1 Tax=Saccharomonospora azurea NA-128 TaxID=882081 RepID=H8GBI3_9PSEU|nr:phosphoglycerate dehydrogenase-like oxidoreductase [Saccharomonospora azurea NA-128]
MEPIERAATVRYAAAADLPDALRGADALFVYDFLSRALPSAWPAADTLGWVHIASAGVDPVMFPELRDSDVVLTNSRGVFDAAIAEYVLGLVIAFAKDFAGSLRLQQQRTWRHRETERVAGTSALVVGTGPIGRAVARLLRAVGMSVAGAGRRARRDDPDFGTVVSSAELTDHVADVDVVVAVAPLTEQTKGMFDARAFAAMKPGSRFVNVGRGELMVTDDLVSALRSGHLSAAALDVFEQEPLPPESPLWTMENVLISAHMSGDVVGWRDALVEVFADNFARWCEGRPLRNVVDKRLGYVPSMS